MNVEVFVTSTKHTYRLSQFAYSDGTSVLTIDQAFANPDKWPDGVRVWRRRLSQTVCTPDAKRCWFEALERFRRKSRWNVFSFDDPEGLSWYSLRKYWSKCGCAGVIHASDAAITYPLNPGFDWYGCRLED